MTTARRSARELLQQLLRDEGLDETWEPELPAQGALLEFAALPRAFNERLVNQVLVPAAARVAASDDASFGWLIAHECIESVPGNVGLYRMKKRPRADRLAAWVRSLGSTDNFPTTPDDSSRADRFIDVSRELADAVVEWGPSWELERLYQLLAADPTLAHQEIAAQYAAADAEFDMLRCWELLKILDEREDLLTDALLHQREDLTRYYGARTSWTEAYTQSAFALEREFMREAFSWAQGDDPRWIAFVEARGGMGKSMFVRWLISRKCVPEPARLPCARIDFDFALPVALAEYPWLVIPQLVAQLEVQLPVPGTQGGATELERLAVQVKEQERIALESQGAAQGAGRALTPERSQRFGAEMAERFGRALHERANGPVLVVFDTIEEAFLRPEFYSTQGRNVIESVLELLATVQAVHPQLKVILAGRFPPSGADGAGDFKARYAGQWQEIELQPFSHDEAHAFLVNVRKLNNDERVAAIIRKSAGLPLVLALWADIVLARDEIRAAEIDASPAADLAYLVERVIDRLHNPQLQWVIRYGVIPRRLTRAFFDGVLVPALREAMRGNAPHDQPSRDRLAPMGGRQRFPTDLLAQPEDLDPGILWDDLTLYVSNSSFVYRSADDPQAIAFHVEVMEPMRRVLREDQEATFRALHASAVLYEQQAAVAPTPETRAAAMREAIHHLLRANPQTTGTHFQQWLDQARDSGDHVMGKVLVEELLSPESARLDESAAPLAPALVGIAHTMRIDALVTEASQATGSDRGLKWVEVVRAVGEYRTFVREHQAAAPPPGWFEIFDAEGTLNTKGAESALPLFEQALAVARDDGLRLPASLGAADSADRLGQSERAAMHARMALSLYERATPQDQTPRRRQDLARVLEAQGDYEAVIDLLATAPPPVSGDPSAPAARLLEAYLATGRSVDAMSFANAHLALVRDMGTEDPDRVAQACGLLAVAQVRHGDTNEALQRVRAELLGLREHVHALRPDEPDRGVRRAAALASSASARVWESVLDLAEAVDSCEQAQRDWAAVGNAEAAGDALRRRIELTVFQLGDRQLAASLIGESLYLTLPAESEVAGRLMLLRTLFHQPAAADVERGLRKLLDDVAVRRWRALRVHVLGALIDTLEAPDAPVLTRFVRDLEAVTPMAARLDLLQGLARLVDRPLRLPADVARQLASVVGLDEPKLPDDAGDAASARLALATAEWLLGRPKEAAGHVDALFAGAIPSPLVPPALDLVRRLVATGQPVAEVAWRIRFGRRDDLTTTANGRIAVAVGELALRAGDPDTATERADEAVADLGGESYPLTRWGALAHAVAAGAARARGDTANWQEHSARADRILESLGLPRMSDPLSRIAVPRAPSRARGPASPPSSPAVNATPIPADRLTPATGPDEPRPVLMLRTQWRQGLVVDVMRDDVVLVPPGSTLAGPSTDLLGPGRDDEVVPFALVRRVADDWHALAGELAAALLRHPVIARALQDESLTEMRLTLDPPAVAALPVELLPAGPEGIPLHATHEALAVYRGSPGRRDFVRWVQESLIENGFRVVADGIWGPQGRAVLAEFQKASGLEPTSVLDRRTTQALGEGLVRDRKNAVALVTGIREGARRATRAASTSVKEHFDVTAMYRYAGLPMESPEKSLVMSLQARRPVVLHLRGTFDESSSLGGVVMRFAGEGMEDGPNGPGESPSTLGSALKLLPPVYRPIVVLDPLPATSHTEIVRQLLLRNVFAHELFRLGVCPAIIAVGFETPTANRVPLTYSVMAEAWKASSSVLDVLRQFRTAAGRERRETTNLVELLRTTPADACVVYATSPSHTLFARPRVAPA